MAVSSATKKSSGGKSGGKGRNAARLVFGEMADELLLASARVEPARLRRTGYRFRFQTLEEALRHLLGKPRAPATPT